MAPKDILLLLDLAEQPSASTAFAIDLAQRSNAHLTAIALAVDPVVTGFVVAPVPVDLIESARIDARNSAQAAVDRFEEQARLAGVSFEIRINEVLMGGIPQGFIASARMSDLIVVGQDNPDRPEPLRDLLIETALYEGVSPVLVVPYIDRAPLKMEKVLVAWDCSRQAARAIHDASLFFDKGTEVTILMVGNAAKQPGEPGADLATWLARHGISASVKTLPGGNVPVADTILNYAIDQGHDVVVMGAYGHSWIREALVGGATRDILRTMTLPVLMAH